MEIKGKVHEIAETQVVSDKFKKREIVIEFAENPQYPEYVKLEAIQEKVSLFDNLKLNDEVEVLFNLKGRKWVNDKGVSNYFNTLQVWKIKVLKSETINSQQEEKEPF